MICFLFSISAEFSEGGIGSASIGEIIAYYLAQAVYEYDVAKVKENLMGADVSTELNYIAEKVSHLATSMMSMGAVVIDNNGVYELLDNN